MGWLADLHDKATEILSTDWRVSNDGIYVPPERVRALCELAEAAEKYQLAVVEREHARLCCDDRDGNTHIRFRVAEDAVETTHVALDDCFAALAGLEPARKEET